MAPAPFDPHRCERARRILTFLRDEPARQGLLQRAGWVLGEARREARYLSWRCIGILADGGRLFRLADGRWAITPLGLQALVEADAFDAAPADWPTLAVPAWILAA